MHLVFLMLKAALHFVSRVNTTRGKLMKENVTARTQPQGEGEVQEAHPEGPIAKVRGI